MRPPIMVPQCAHQRYRRLVRYCPACTARTHARMRSSAYARLVAVLCVPQRVHTHSFGSPALTDSASIFRFSVLHDARALFINCEYSRERGSEAPETQRVKAIDSKSKHVRYWNGAIAERSSKNRKNHWTR